MEHFISRGWSFLMKLNDEKFYQINYIEKKVNLLQCANRKFRNDSSKLDYNNFILKNLFQISFNCLMRKTSFYFFNFSVNFPIHQQKARKSQVSWFNKAIFSPECFLQSTPPHNFPGGVSSNRQISLIIISNATKVREAFVNYYKYLHIMC